MRDLLGELMIEDEVIGVLDWQELGRRVREAALGAVELGVYPVGLFVPFSGDGAADVSERVES
jgi:hypothetical protein